MINNETTQKKYYKKEDHIELRPAHKGMDSFITKNGDFKIEGKVVGVTTGTTQETAAKEVDKKYKLKEIKLYPSDIEGVSDLINGRLDAFIGAKLQMAYRKKAKNQPIRIVGNRLNESFKGAAFRKTETELMKKFNMALESMKKDGSYETLSKKWFGINIGQK